MLLEFLASVSGAGSKGFPSSRYYPQLEGKLSIRRRQGEIRIRLKLVGYLRHGLTYEVQLGFGNSSGVSGMMSVGFSNFEHGFTNRDFMRT